MTLRLISLFLLFLSLPFARGAAQAPAAPVPFEIPRLTGPIVVDGNPGDAAWQKVAPLPLTMYSPVFNGTPTQRTEIRVACDDDALYAAGWFYDTNPAGIRVNSLYRDRWNGDDAFALIVDAFNDGQNAKMFLTTPAGVRYDQLISDDGTALNDNWDSFWTGRTSMTREGWFAEVRIPFSTLGSRGDASGKVVMGLTVTRLISRNEERVTFPSIDPASSYYRPSVSRDVELTGVKSGRPLYVTPYILGGSSTNAVALDGGSFQDDSKTSHEAGLDVRYSLSDQLTLDLTANTDFAQVEADGEQVSQDRFPLFFPERRRFFQEGSGIFDFVTAGGGRLFHSRRIGLTDDGRPLRILGGARLVGKAGPWDVGFLEMQTASHDRSAGENFGVLRMRRPVLNSSSVAGFMLTSYLSGGRHNLAAGADTSLRVTGDEYVTLKWAGTEENGQASSDLVRRSLFDAKWERRTERGLAYTWQFSRAGDQYDPAIGFLPRQDYTTANVAANDFIFTDSSHIFKRVYPGALAFTTFRNSDHALESAQYAVWVEWDTKGDGGGWVEPKKFHEDVLSPFEIGRGIHIPAGSYDFADLQIVGSMSPGSRLRTDVNFRAGTYFDGRRRQIILTPTWNASRHVELGGSWQVTQLRFPSRGESETIQLVGLRLLTALNAKASGNAFVQYNSTTRRVDFNVRLRYAFEEGTDFWLVYNEGLDAAPSHDDPAIPDSPRLLSRALILKYTHTFTF